MNKLDEEDYGLGKPEDLEFKVILFDDGRYYEGEVIKGTIIRQGRGFRYGPSFYEGYWKNDQQHGKGLKIYQNGNYYLGDWQYSVNYGDSIQRVNGKISRIVTCLDGSSFSVKT